MSPNAARIATLFAACLATAACAPDYGAGRCAPAETVSVDYAEQICFAGRAGYEACRWVPKTYVVAVPATCEAAVTIRATPLVRK